MIAALALASTLLAAPRGGCYLVGNKRIDIIPCNFDPTVIADRLAKMEGQPPADASGAAAPDPNAKQARVQARASPAAGERARPPRRDAPQSAASPPAPSSGQQPGGVAATEVQRADPAQTAAPPTIPPRETAQPPTAQPQPATAQMAVPGPSGAPQAASQSVDAQRVDARRAVDAAAAELRGLEPALASGSAPDAQGVLARAAQAFTAANDSRGAASIARAQEALARGDFFAARQAIAAAINATAQR